MKSVLPGVHNIIYQVPRSKQNGCLISQNSFPTENLNLSTGCVRWTHRAYSLVLLVTG